MINASSNNRIGGLDPGSMNLICNGVVIGNGSSFNQVMGNYLGPDVTGSVAIGEGSRGIALELGATDNTIGPGNVMSGNDIGGILLFNPTTTRNRIIGNIIGLNADGTAPLPNTSFGIVIEDAPGNTIGGPNPADRNIISASELDHGILIIGPDATDNVITGNYIGTDATGELGFGNNAEGILIRGGASANTIGPGNVISANGGSGILIIDVGTSETQLVQARLAPPTWEML